MSFDMESDEAESHFAPGNKRKNVKPFPLTGNAESVTEHVSSASNIQMYGNETSPFGSLSCCELMSVFSEMDDFSEQNQVPNLMQDISSLSEQSVTPANAETKEPVNNSENRAKPIVFTPPDIISSAQRVDLVCSNEVFETDLKKQKNSDEQGQGMEILGTYPDDLTLVSTTDAEPHLMDLADLVVTSPFRGVSWSDTSYIHSSFTNSQCLDNSSDLQTQLEIDKSSILEAKYDKTQLHDISPKSSEIRQQLSESSEQNELSRQCEDLFFIQHSCDRQTNMPSSDMNTFEEADSSHVIQATSIKEREDGGLNCSSSHLSGLCGSLPAEEMDKEQEQDHESEFVTSYEDKVTGNVECLSSTRSQLSLFSDSVFEQPRDEDGSKDIDVIAKGKLAINNDIVSGNGDLTTTHFERNQFLFSNASNEDVLSRTDPTTVADRTSSSSSISNSSLEEKKTKTVDVINPKNKGVPYSSSRTKAEELTTSVNSPLPNSGTATSQATSLKATKFPISTFSSSSSSSSTTNEIPRNISLSAPLSSNIHLPITQLGRVAPTWLPDSEAPKCMQCDTPFSFTRRRHHCRACGKIFCSNCSSLKAALQYLENKECRVCSKCYQDLIRAQYYLQTHRKSNMKPNPNNPSEYCSMVSPLLQVQTLTPVLLPSVMVPTAGVLRKQGSIKCKPETKQVMFADGIRPGGDLTEVDGISDMRHMSVHVGRRTKKVEKPGEDQLNKSHMAPKQSTCLIPSFGALPPVVISTLTASSSSLYKGYSLLDSPTVEFVLHHLLNTENPKPVTFAIDKFLAVIVKIVNLDCCVNRTCWSFTTKGMSAVGQDEIVILLECLPDEKKIPVDIFHHLHLIYQQASQGNPVTPMGHSVLAPGAFGDFEHGGFLFIRQTFQCIEKLILPEPPFLFGILLQKWEMSWAKVFPLRLLLRLGAEFRYYPCPLVSVRNRRPVYGEIGHTIMNLLADFHNYQYKVPQINGLTIRLEDRKTTMKIPCNRYDSVMKVLNSTNDHVLALGADLNIVADSHLVSIQNEDGNYQTQAINIQDKMCKATGASFIVFNGALKPSSGLLAKSSIVEDGVMVQVTPSTMTELRQSWKEMKNYTINCSGPSSDDVVMIEWVDEHDFMTVNKGVKSPVNGMPLQGIESRYIQNATDFSYDDHIIRWTELFLLHNEMSESTNANRLIDSIAHSAALALVPHSPHLARDMMTRIGLRVTINADEVSFKAGSKGHPLPDFCIYDLEEKLMPLLQKYSLSSSSPSSSINVYQGTMDIELIFHILHPAATISGTPAVAMPD